MNDFPNLFDSELERLRHTERFQTCRRNRQESVAEHSYYVCLYTSLICRWLQERGIDVDVNTALEAAIYHDMEESVSGDFPRPFKYSHPDLRESLNVAATMAAEQVAASMWPDNQIARKWMVGRWQTKGPATQAGRIVEFADFLAALVYIREEVRSGNLMLVDHAVEIGRYFMGFCDWRKYPEFNNPEGVKTDSMSLTDVVGQYVMDVRKEVNR